MEHIRIVVCGIIRCLLLAALLLSAQFFFLAIEVWIFGILRIRWRILRASQTQSRGFIHCSSRSILDPDQVFGLTMGLSLLFGTDIVPTVLRRIRSREAKWFSYGGD